jgi:hypothetical protein
MTLTDITSGAIGLVAFASAMVVAPTDLMLLILVVAAYWSSSQTFYTIVELYPAARKLRTLVIGHVPKDGVIQVSHDSTRIESAEREWISSSAGTTYRNILRQT